MTIQIDLFDNSEPPPILPAAKDPSLRSVQIKLESSIEDGSTCPCCGQYVRVYKRKLNSIMAKWLIWLVRRDRSSDELWHDIRRAAVRGGDYAKLLHWGLVAHKQNTDPSKRTSGLWRPTSIGVQFALNQCRAPSHVHIYNNRPVAFSTRSVSIVEALGARFDYQELMSK